MSGYNAPMPVRVTAATASDLPTACRFAAAHASDPDARAARLYARVAAGDFDLADLLVARIGRTILGAISCPILPGATAGVWPPGLSREAEPSVADRLAEAAIAHFRAHGVKVAHAFASPEDCPKYAALERAGFRALTDLAFLARGGHTGEFGGPVLEYERVDARDPRFVETLFETYVGTLDCPELNDTRTTAEVLAGYASAEESDWYLVSEGLEPIGITMFGPPMRPGAVELSYLGLVPAARGRGLGRDLVRFALQYAAPAGLSLSVDVRNEPALKLYASFGFARIDRQTVYLWRP